MTAKLVAIVLAAFLALGTSARATLLAEPFSVATTVTPFVPLGSTSQFASFDPALGTLTSLSVSLSGTLDYTGLGSPGDEGATVQLQEDPAISPFICNSTDVNCLVVAALGNNLAFSFALTDVNDPLVLSEYTGGGLSDFDLNLLAFNATDSLTFDGTGMVTYDYTPAVAAPEPGSLSLLLLAVTVIVGATRFRRSGVI